ncbi:MAG: nucleoside hydrolase [Saprospiraceae bacterium]|nr:nucleoside hydrolase [Saprospiraceae bacterium]
MKYYLWAFTLLLSLMACNNRDVVNESENEDPAANMDVEHKKKVSVIFDTDANNELDDQHALAYLLLNGETFNVRGITVNATPSGGEIQNHYDEALRIMKLCKAEGNIPLYNGANANFTEIENSLDQPDFDGHEAVDFIIEEALNHTDEKLVLIPVGKLTNIALALKKQPSIIDHIRIVWLGSNYPEPGEYNQNSDVPSMNYVLASRAPFEMVTVRYGHPSGTGAVVISQNDINSRMPGKGPKIETPITGRHGGEYATFGDYSISLFEHIHYDDEAKNRALFDLAAVAIVKNPLWAENYQHPCPKYVDGTWIEQPQNERTITIWENFNRAAIIADLFATLDHPVFVTR